MIINKQILLSVIISCIVTACIASDPDTLCIPFINSRIIIDGNDRDWDEAVIARIAMSRYGHPWDNSATINMSWDELNLYILFRVSDHHLVGLEKTFAYRRMHYNDGVEVYIDSHNDSRDIMDINDYHFVIDLKGNPVIFRGDRLDKVLFHTVPQEPGIANIIFRVAASHSGTINRNNDRDSIYLIEISIPWSGIGVSPKAGTLLKIDLCMNDNDTVVDFSTVPEGPVRHYSFLDIGGHTDFGYPSDWKIFTLTGKPDLISRLTQKYTREWVYLFIATLVVSLAILGLLFRRIRKLTSIPQKKELASTALLQVLMAKKESPDPSSTTHPVILKAREYIRQHIDQPLRPETLACELAMSLRNLQRLLKTQLDTTPTNFILLLKLEHAADLLLTRNKTIAEVALLVGYNDPAYFSRVFRKYFGCTPTEFVSRKNASSGQNTGRLS